MMRYSLIIFLILAVLKVQIATAQPQNNPKLEREERIDIQDFPLKSLDIIKELNTSRSKIKLYKETDGYLISYEAKYRNNGKKYSVECTKDGLINDIEVQVKTRDISKAAFNEIQLQLNKISSRYRIQKIQRQYLIQSQDATTILKRLESNDFDNYEIVVAFKENRKIYRKELLFNSKGELLMQRDVKRLEYDFLLF